MKPLEKQKDIIQDLEDKKMLKVIGAFQYDNLIKTRAFKRDVHLKLREATLFEFKNQIKSNDDKNECTLDNSLDAKDDTLLEFADEEN